MAKLDPSGLDPSKLPGATEKIIAPRIVKAKPNELKLDPSKLPNFSSRPKKREPEIPFDEQAKGFIKQKSSTFKSIIPDITLGTLSQVKENVQKVNAAITDTAATLTEGIKNTKVKDAFPGLRGSGIEFKDETIGQFVDEPISQIVKKKKQLKRILELGIPNIDFADIIPGEEDSFIKAVGKRAILPVSALALGVTEAAKLSSDTIPDTLPGIALDLLPIALSGLVKAASHSRGSLKIGLQKAIKAKLEMRSLSNELRIADAQAANHLKQTINNVRNQFEFEKIPRRRETLLKFGERMDILGPKRKVILPETIIENMSFKNPIPDSHLNLAMLKKGTNEFLSEIGEQAIGKSSRKSKELSNKFVKFLRQKRQKALSEPLPGENIQGIGVRLGQERKDRVKRLGEVGFFDRAFRETRGVLQRMGPGGTRVARMMDAAEEGGKMLGAEAGEPWARALQGLSRKDTDIIGKALDPTRAELFDLQNMSEKARRAYKKILKVADDLHREAIKTGDKIMDSALEPNKTFKHIYDFSNPRVVNKTLAQIMESKFIKSKASVEAAGITDASKRAIKTEQIKEFMAKEILDDFMNGSAGVNIRRARVYDGSHDLAKLYGVNTYEKDLSNVLEEMSSSYARRISQSNQFGENDMDLLQEIADLPDSKFAKDLFESQFLSKPFTGVGLVDDKTRSVFRKLKMWNVTSKLGLAQIRNATGSVNTALVTNVKSTRKAFLELSGEMGLDKTSRLIEQTITQSYRDLIREGLGISKAELAGSKIYSHRLDDMAQLVLDKTGFLSVERMNRRVAGLSGRFYMREQAQLLKTLDGAGPRAEFARRRLLELGVSEKRIKSIISNGKLTAKEEFRGALRVIQQSQFETNVMDLPLYWSSDVGRFAAQFKSFGFRHSVLIKKVIFDEIAHGSAREGFSNIGLFGSWGGMAGLTSQTMVDFLRGKSFDDFLINEAISGKISPWQAALQSYGAVGGIGIYLDMVFQITPEILGERGGSQAAGRLNRAITGPGLSTVSELTAASGRVALSPFTSINARQGVKRLIREVPVVGPAVSEAVLGKKTPAIVEVGKAIVGATILPIRAQQAAARFTARRAKEIIEGRLINRREK